MHVFPRHALRAGLAALILASTPLVASADGGIEVAAGASGTTGRGTGDGRGGVWATATPTSRVTAANGSRLRRRKFIVLFSPVSGCRRAAPT